MSNIVTSEVRFAFVSLFKTRKNDEGKEKYGVTLLFPHPGKITGTALVEYNACMAKLKQAAADAARERFGALLDKKNEDGTPKLVLRSPFRNQGDKADKYAGYVDGAIFLNVTSEQRPECVDETVQPIIEPSKIYSGCYGRVSLRAFGYGGPGTKFVPGVAFGLQNVQKLRDGEPLGGSGPASADFQPMAGAVAAGAADPTKLFG